MYCKYCGKESLSDVEYCSHCGKKIGEKEVNSSSTVEESKQPKKTHSTLIIFLLGMLVFGIQLFLTAATKTHGSSKDANAMSGIFAIVYIFLFICFLVSLFKKPKQSAPAISKSVSTEESKPAESSHPGRWKWYLSFILFIILPILYLIVTGPGVINPALGTITILIPIIFSGWFVWYLFNRHKQKDTNFFQTIKNVIDFSKHRPKFAGGLVAVAVIFVLAVYLLLVKINNDNFKNMQQTAAIIQDTLSDAAAAKIMGDSIYKGRYMPGATWAQVQTNAKNDADLLASLSVPNSLANYRQTALDWTNQIAKAPQTYTWNKLADQPEDFVLRLNDTQVKTLLQASYKKISDLKSMGENAILRKDRETMRYIAAKLLVQEHWIKGIQHSKNNGLLGFKLINTAWAYSEQDCINIAMNCAQKCAYSSNIMSCVQPCANELEAYCSDVNNKPEQPTSPPQPQSTQPPVEPTRQPLPQNTVVPKEKSDEPTATPSPYTYAPEPRKDSCIPGKTASYCAEEVVQSVNEIEASSVKFAEGADVSIDDWDKMFKPFDDLFPEAQPEGGVGITQGEPDAIYVPPQVQTFNNECAAKGGRTNSPSIYMSRLPTTESGYYCSYKQGGNNCLDFMTYSGGRYLGGNPGCPEKNLVPIARNAPVAKNPPPPVVQTADWNGTYDIVSWSVNERVLSSGNKECTNKNRPYSFNVNGNVVNNPSGWGNNNPSIDQVGAANCNDKSCAYQFYGSGTKAYMTGTGTESAAACLKKPNCNFCQYKVTAKHR